MTRIALIIGHPGKTRFSHALAQAYQEGATSAGHEVRVLNLSEMAFDPILHEGYEGDQPIEPDIQTAQDAITWAEHLVIVYPIWGGTMPALLKGFIERAFLPGFAYGSGRNGKPRKLLSGRSARLIITMGAPAFWYRWVMGAHGVKVLKHHILKFCGITPVRTTYFGLIGTASEAKRKQWLEQVRAHGINGA